MAHQVDHKCDRCRRQGEKLFLKGERCSTPKCAITRRAYAPGQHGPTSRSRTSEYGQQFKQKQKARSSYDVLERQFRKYFELATRSSGMTGEQLLKHLELRLDNVVFRMQLASSRRTARQMVRHGHILVNEKHVNLPAYALKVGDVISLSERGKKLPQIEERRKGFQTSLVPSWLEVDAPASTATLKAEPAASDVSSDLDLQQIVEYYSR